MVQIYSENNTNYEYNGDVTLDPIACDLHVVLNGSWEVTLECPLDDQDKFQAVLTDAVICADTPQGNKQLFRIYDVQRSDDGVVAYARPIFLDSAKDVFFVDTRPTELTGQQALNWLMDGTPYSGYTDITLKKTAYYIRKNLIEALAGTEDNSFLSRWGGEITYDNYKINILVQQGEDRGLRVEFGTNIESIQETIDVDEMGTRLVPVAFNGRTLDGDEPWVDSPLINNYPIVYYKIVEFDDMRLTEDFYTDEDGNTDEDMDDYDVYDTLEQLQAAMVERCKQLFVEGIDTPSITYDINMIDLRQTDEYKDYQDLETVNLGDTVYCYHRRLGIETKARVIEYTYDCIRKCITSIVIGDYQEDYLDHLSDITSSSGGTVDFSQIWSQFDYIEANYVKTNQLEAEIGKFGYLTAAEADITYARITDLDAALITVNELIADQIYAVYADIGVLDADVANIISLLGGDIATGTLDTIHLTADNAVIDSEVVLQAIIEEAIIGDLLAGIIYTDQVTIMDNENGDMILTGPTIQFKDGDGNYRMQIGLDGEGNFNIYIFDELGNLLFDALGLTEAGLIGNGAIIRDVAVADDANISGYKLNIQEVAECLTADGTLIVDAGQVIINGETLSAVYTEIRQDVDSALTEAEKALEAAGGLIEIGARNYLLNTRALTQDAEKSFYTGFSRSVDESDFGVLTEAGSGSVTVLTAISAEKDSLNGKKMVFSMDMFEEELTSILEDCELKFGVFRSNDDGETWNEYASISSDMSEDDVFEFNRGDLTDDEWCRLVAKFTAMSSSIHIHTPASAPVFTWADDYSTCTATYTCASCGDTITEECSVTETETEPTCTEDGLITHIAAIEIGGTVYMNEAYETVPALGHDWQEPTFEWVSDYSECNALFPCSRCDEIHSEPCTITSEIEGQTCTEDGVITYTATVTFEGKTYTGQAVDVAPALGHDYSEAEFHWTEDYSECYVELICSRGDDSLNVDCVISSTREEPTDTETGKIIYTATAEYDGVTYTDTKEDIIPALGHTYGAPTFEWADDFTCVAVFVCINDDDTQRIDCDISESVIEEPSCTEEGTAEYTATCIFDGETYSDSKTGPIAATGHTYGRPTFEWTDPGYPTRPTCVAVFTCESGDDTQTVDCTVTVGSSMRAATCTEDGYMEMEAIVTFNGTTYHGWFNQPIPATGHDYGDPVFTWSDDYESCTATFTCSRGDDTQVVECTVTIGDGENTATVEFNGKTYTDTVTVVVTAFAIYSADDNSFTFYSGGSVPEAGGTYKDKTVTNIYTGFESEVWGDGDSTWWSIRSQTTTVVFDSSFKKIKPISMAYWFYQFTSLTDIVGGENVDTSNVTTMSLTFASCSALTNIDSLADWDTSNVTDLQSTFYSCSALSNIDALVNWNTDLVTTMYMLFADCSGISGEVAALQKWNTASVTTMYRMFYNCSGITVLWLDNFDTVSVTNMDEMFRNCSNLTTVYVHEGQFDIGKLTSQYNNMFSGCSSIVGGNGTKYNGMATFAQYARIDASGSAGYFTKSPEWSLAWLTYNSTLWRYGIQITPKGSHALQLRKPKLEIGTVATDWSPAPEDPNEELYEMISILQTDFSVVQGEIQAKIWETDIKEATDGLYESITEMYSYVNETVNSITAEVGNLTYIVDENYASLTAQISTLIITDSEITSRVISVEQEMGGIFDPKNILLHTEDMDMSVPWKEINTEQETIYTWRVYSSDDIPAGSSYVYASPSSGVGDSGFYAGSYHWHINDDILYENISKLTEGEVYTFSFYIKYDDSYQPILLWINNCLYGQTVLDCNYPIWTDGPTSSNFNKDYIIIPFQSSNTHGTWQRVSITFRLDDKSNFRLGFSYGTWESALVGINLCGLTLSAGYIAAAWDNGSTSVYAKTKYVMSEIQQLTDNITATVAAIYGDLDYVYTQIEMLPDTMKLTVGSASNGSASIILTVNGEESGGSLYSNGLRNAFANDTSAITISAGTITFNSNTFIVNSSYFSVTAAGVVTATSGTIGGWNITSNALYHISSAFSNYTAGAICFSEDGLSVNTESGTWVVDSTGWSQATTFQYVRKTMINNNGIEFRGYINESSNTDHVPLGFLSEYPMIQPMFFSSIEDVTTSAYGFIGLRIGCQYGRIQLYCNELDVIDGSTTYTGASGYYTLGNYRLHFVNGLVVEIS